MASFASSHVPPLAPFIDTLPSSDLKTLTQFAVENLQLATALADLAVTGRSAYTKFRAMAPSESSLLNVVLGLLRGWPGASQDTVLFAIGLSVFF